MDTYNYRLDVMVDGVREERTGQIQADSQDAARVELRKTPGYIGCGMQSVEAKRPFINNLPAKPQSLGWIDPMFSDL